MQRKLSNLLAITVCCVVGATSIGTNLNAAPNSQNLTVKQADTEMLNNLRDLREHLTKKIILDHKLRTLAFHMQTNLVETGVAADESKYLTPMKQLTKELSHHKIAIALIGHRISDLEILKRSAASAE